MKILRLSIVVLSLIVVLGSCKKEETKKQKLCGKYWINTAITVEPAVLVNGTPILDWFSQMNQCDKDDLQKFDENGVYTFDEGASKCSIDAPQSVNGTWSFNSDETIASVSWGGNTRSYSIIDLSSTKLVAKYSTVGNDGLTYTFTVTMVPK